MQPNLPCLAGGSWKISCGCSQRSMRNPNAKRAGIILQMPPRRLRIGECLPRPGFSSCGRPTANLQPSESAVPRLPSWAWFSSKSGLDRFSRDFHQGLKIVIGKFFARQNSLGKSRGSGTTPHFECGVPPRRFVRSGKASNTPAVTATKTATCSGTDNGWPWGCFKTSRTRRPRSKVWRVSSSNRLLNREKASNSSNCE